MKKIDYNVFLDKVHGCWYGKCLGGAAGAPAEALKKVIEVRDFSDIYNPDIPNDDLDLQLLWLEVLEQKGTVINSCDLADAWVEKCQYTMSEYGYFLKNYMRGIKPPYTGIINNNFFNEGMGCPIRAEIWAIISAGNPKLASDYAYMDGTLDHEKNSVWAEQMIAAMESMAFFENDMLEIINESMKYIPNNSKLFDCCTMVIEEYKKNTDCETIRTMILNKFGHPDFTNVVQNMGFVFMALLYGKADMRDTINMALRCGYDADCTCAIAASVVGIINGYSNLGDTKSLINDYFVCGIDVVRPSNSIKRLAEDTCKVALASPNYEIEITDVPKEFSNIKRPENFKGFNLILATEKGLEEAKKLIKPTIWHVSVPYYGQPEFPPDVLKGCRFNPGVMLNDVVCGINNAVNLDTEYIDEKKLTIANEACIIKAYEDLIDIDSSLTAEGQICCYLKTTLNVDCDRKLWAIIGNNDGFVMWCNKKEIIRKDEIRMWTPFNNNILFELKKGENEIVLKLLRRTDKLNFSIGYKIYDEKKHWHGSSKWYFEK